MNKYLFWLITMVVSIILCVVVGIAGFSFLTSDQYVPLPNESIPQDGEEYLSLDEYAKALENSNTDEEILKLQDKMPFELRLVYARTTLIGVLCMVVSMVLVVFIGWLYKDKKQVDFDVLYLDKSDKKINVVRISLYIVMLMVSVVSTSTYPAAFLPGWGVTVMWLAYIFVLTVWILNIMYAFKERRQKKRLGRV